MRIGKQDRRASAISTSTPEAIHVRGRDLCGALIGKTDFTSYFWLLVTGEEPDDQQLFFANAVLTAIAEHGHAIDRCPRVVCPQRCATPSSSPRSLPSCAHASRPNPGPPARPAAPRRSSSKG